MFLTLLFVSFFHLFSDRFLFSTGKKTITLSRKNIWFRGLMLQFAVLPSEKCMYAISLLLICLFRVVNKISISTLLPPIVVRGIFASSLLLF